VRIGRLVIELERALNRVYAFVHRNCHGFSCPYAPRKRQRNTLNSCQIEIETSVVGTLSHLLFELRLQGLQFFLIVGFPGGFNGCARGSSAAETNAGVLGAIKNRARNR